MTAVYSIISEAERAQLKYGDFTSTHEALGVMIEEFDELRAAIHANKLASISNEAMQVSAVALRLHDICERAMAGNAEPFRVRSGA